MAFDYPQRNGWQVGTDFDGASLNLANFTGGQFNVSFPLGSLARRLFYACGSVACKRCGDGQTTFVADPHSAPFNRHLPHLYTVELLIQMPFISNGTLGCRTTPDLPTSPAITVCGSEVDQAHYEGRVIGDMTWLDHSAVVIDPTFESEPSPGGAINRRPWPNYDVYDGGVLQAGSNPALSLQTRNAYLENPDPVWPVPDAQGSTFGRVLFTLAQIPWELGVTFVHHGHDDHLGDVGFFFGGALNGRVRGYLLGRRAPTVASITAGAALAGIRPRGKIVGQLVRP